MNTRSRLAALGLVMASVGCADDGPLSGPDGVQSGARFFVTSATSPTGNLGGPAGADRCSTIF
jgi:hypothetical protein